jgi:hypothetical protein
MEPWDTNIRILRARYPGLAEELAQEEAAGVVAESASGAPTLIVQGLHVHSPRDPVREGRRLAGGLTGKGPLVALGFGLGYAPEAAAAAFPERPLIILERRRDLLRKALESRDLAAFLERRNIIFITGGTGEALTGALRLMEEDPQGQGPPELLKNRVLVQLDEAWYGEAERRLQSWASRDDVNLATLRRFGRRWVRNLARNLRAIRDLPGISRLEGCLSALPSPPPVLLVAAGPSLDRLRPFLPAFADRCVLVAVDTSLRLLLEQGVSPDFTVAVDPQYWNARHLDRTEARGSRLIAESAVYPPVLRHPFGGAFLCQSLFPLGRFIEDRVDPKGQLGAGGSVATTAWDFARVLGPSSIWLAGLDLGFPGLRTHFKGAVFEERALAEGRRLLPSETRSFRALRDGRPFPAPAAGGGQVLTDRRLSLYSAWFEERFRMHPRIRNRSFSPGGLAISGMEAAEPEELLGLPPRREEIRRALEGAFARAEGDFRSPEAGARREAAYGAALGELVRGLEAILDLAAEAREIAERACREASRGSGAVPPEVPAELEGINARIHSSGVKDVAGFLFPPVSELEAALESPGSDPLGRYLELSAKLYRALGESADYNLSMLRSRRPPEAPEGGSITGR